MGALPEEDSGMALMREKQGGGSWKSHHDMVKSLKVTEDRDRSSKCRAWYWYKEHRSWDRTASRKNWKKPRKKIPCSKRQGVQWDHSTAGTQMEPEVPPSIKYIIFLKGFSPPQPGHTQRHLHVFLFVLFQLQEMHIKSVRPLKSWLLQSSILWCKCIKEWTPGKKTLHHLKTTAVPCAEFMPVLKTAPILTFLYFFTSIQITMDFIFLFSFFFFF